MPQERSFICPEAEESFVFPNIFTYRYPSARGREAFLQRKNGRRGVAEHSYSEKMGCEGSPSISTAKKRSARGRRAFPQRKNGRRGVAEHSYNEKMAGEGSRSIPTTKKWPARARRAFPQRKNGRRGVAEHFHNEKMAGEGSRSIPTAKFSFRSLNRPFRVCFFYITAQRDGHAELVSASHCEPLFYPLPSVRS